jgi:CubicO group peptidase (beta-lactamase class C family)
MKLKKENLFLSLISTLLKTVLYTTLLFSLLCACQIKPEGPTVRQEDSLEYYPPTPPALSKQEFRYYHNVVKKFFDSLLISNGFNGSILVAKNGAVVYENYIGFQDLRKKDSLTYQSAFHIASTSKTFTGMAILQLVQEGKINLNDSISKYFPGFPYAGITIKMLLTHRSGLPNYLYYLSDKKVWDRKVNVINQDVLNTLYNLQPNKSYNPNRRFNYCNTNFVLLAMILEKVTGINYKTYMKQKFFTPLQMNNTFVLSREDSSKALLSFQGNGRPWALDQFEETYGDKNIYSTPQDLLKWDQAVQNGLVINQTLMDSAFTPYSNERPSIHNYGLAWRLLMFPNGKKVIYHNGRWHGNNSFFAHLPDEKVTIIVLGNKFNRHIYSTRYIYDLFGHYLQNRDDDGEDENENGTGHLNKKDPADKILPVTYSTDSMPNKVRLNNSARQASAEALASAKPAKK